MSSDEDLAGYPMLFSYSQSMLNKKIREEFNAGNRNMFPESITFNSEDHGSFFNLSKFGSPTVSFDAPIKSQACKLTIPIVTGDLKFASIKYVNGVPTIVNHSVDFGGHHLHIVTEVKKRTHQDFSDANFTIESIYADLSNVIDARIEYDDTSTVYVGSLPSAVNTMVSSELKKWVTRYKEQHNQQEPMMFGGARLPTKVAAYDLRPTACTYSVTVSRDKNNKYVAGALNMLLQVEGNPLLTTASSGIIDELVPEPHMEEGVLVLSSWVFSRLVVLPTFQANDDYKKFSFDTKHAKNGEQGEMYLTKSVSENVSGATLTYKTFDGGFVPGFYRLSQEIDSTVDYWSGDDHYHVSSHLDTSFSIVENKLVASHSSIYSHAQKQSGGFWHDFGQGFAMGVTLGIDAAVRDSKTSGACDTLVNAASKVTFPANTALDCIILPGGSTGVFEYSGVSIKQGVNKECNMFLYAKFT